VSTRTNAAPAWLEQRERGNHFMMRTLAAIALTFGRRTAGLLLYPICCYFIVFSRSARRASRDYLRRVLNRRPRLSDTLRQYLCFATTILDRVFLHAGRLDLFTVDFEGLDIVQQHVDAREGCLLIGAHFGSFDMLRAIAHGNPDVDLRVLMHTGRAEKLDRVMRSLDTPLAAQVIALGLVRTMLDVRDTTARGGIVALLGDRAVANDRLVACDFLGEAASFPEGPFALALALRVPVILFTATSCGGGRYRIRFERFPLSDGAAGPSTARRRCEAECRAFASWLDRNCRDAPYNWFNFYDFWAPAPPERRP
jgi:predicted LPLAT superfamily acyltransferase